MSLIVKLSTNLKRDSGIVEIGAWAFDASGDPGPGLPSIPGNYDRLDKQRADIFHKFVLPDRPMNPMAAKINGIKKAGMKNLKVRGQMHYNVDTAFLAMRKFLDWLKTFKGYDICLVAHNGFRFDAPGKFEINCII